MIKENIVLRPALMWLNSYEWNWNFSDQKCNSRATYFAARLEHCFRVK
jgi:hypothetical protein